MFLQHLGQILRRIVFSDIREEPLGHKVLNNQLERFWGVWTNELKPESNAIGIERIIRLVLVLLQFPFPGIYVRAFFGRFGVLWKNVGIELYVLFKIGLASAVLAFQVFNWFHNIWFRSLIAVLVIYMILESLLYTATLVFCNDVFASPRSYKRNIILLLCDYVEVILDFASLYLIGSALKFSCDGCGDVLKSIDAAYFSFVTSVTIGYGDIVVANDFGKVLVILQAIVFLIYGVLFLNFYISRIEEPEDGLESRKTYE